MREQVAAVRPAPPKAPDLPPTRRDHGDARAAGLDDCPHQLGHRKLARVRLLQTYSTAIQQQQDGLPDNSL